VTIYLQNDGGRRDHLRYTESNGVQTFYRAKGGLAFAVSARTDRRRLLEVARDADAQLSRARLHLSRRR